MLMFCCFSYHNFSSKKNKNYITSNSEYNYIASHQLEHILPRREERAAADASVGKVRQVGNPARNFVSSSVCLGMSNTLLSFFLLPEIASLSWSRSRRAAQTPDWRWAPSQAGRSSKPSSAVTARSTPSLGFPSLEGHCYLDPCPASPSVTKCLSNLHSEQASFGMSIYWIRQCMEQL